MKKIFFLVAFAGICNSHARAQKKVNGYSPFGIEVDPMAYILNGYSVHGIYHSTAHWSFDAGVFGISEPEFYSGNKGFITQHRGVGAKVHYHFRAKDTKGFYVGYGNGYTITEATDKESKTKVRGHGWSAGIHSGYQFFLLKNNHSKGLYLTPWVSLDYQLHGEKIRFEHAAYKQNNLSLFPTVHIGYRF